MDPVAAHDAAKAAAARKAERTPGKLTAAEAQLLPGKHLLELANGGKVPQLRLGAKPLPPPATPPVAAPKGTSRSAAQRGGKTPGRTAAKTTKTTRARTGRRGK